MAAFFKAPTGTVVWLSNCPEAPRPDGKLNAGRVLFQDTTFSASPLDLEKTQKNWGMLHDGGDFVCFWSVSFIKKCDTSI